MAMDMPDMPVNVPVDDPNEDTEWNDILRKHGVIPEKPPSPSAKIEEALQEAHQLAHENRLEGLDIDQLDALEDLEDEAFLDSYRTKRLAELTDLSQRSVYNQVYPLQKPDYAVEVTQESDRAYVFVLLTSSSGINTQSRLAIELWRRAAATFGDIKFCQMQADLCIEGYPDRNTPTVLVYHKGNIVRQIVTLKAIGGDAADMRGFEGLLKAVGAVEHGDSRLESRNDPGRTKPVTSNDDDDSDDD